MSALLIYFPVFILLLHCTCICRQNKHYSDSSDSDSDAICVTMKEYLGTPLIQRNTTTQSQIGLTEHNSHYPK